MSPPCWKQRFLSELCLLPASSDLYLFAFLAVRVVFLFFCLFVCLDTIHAADYKETFSSIQETVTPKWRHLDP